MIRPLLITFMSLILADYVVAQSWSPWQPLYDDPKISVEVQFKVYNNSCQGGKQSKFRYRLSPGTLRSTPYYVTWKMDYIDCNGEPRYEVNSINIGQGATLNALDESMDYRFSCSSMLTPVYDVSLSSGKVQTAGRRIIPLSEPATSIVSKDTLYQGEVMTLNHTGGLLGEGAEWVWYASKCGDIEVGRGDSITVNPTKSQNYYLRAEGANNTTPCISKRIRVFQNSIVGKKEIYKGESETLRIRGANLAPGLKWVWYKDKCEGSPIMFGDTLTVSPLETTTYFARLDGLTEELSCVKKQISVSKKSSDPLEVEGETLMCEGETIDLKVSGGYLGEEADWVWYESSCGGVKLGSGQSISVNPNSTTTFYVRAESKYNTTNCTSITVKVLRGSLVPESVTGDFIICEGETTNMKVVGGRLGSNAEWRWYKNKCDGVLVGTGTEISVAPSYTERYFVRAEGDCNTACVETMVTVKTRSRKPYSISKSPSDILQNKEVKLSTSGGVLGTGADWKWYTGTCNEGKLVGTGDNIFVKAKSGNTYHVRAEGDCNDTPCSSFTLQARKAHRFDPVFTNSQDDRYNNKFLHIGGGIGLEFNRFKSSNTSRVILDPVGSNPLTVDTNELSQSPLVSGIGLTSEFVFHPYMNDYFSVGLITGGAVGTTTRFIPISSAGAVNEEYVYSRLDVGLELAAGAKPFKVLLGYRIGVHTEDFEMTKKSLNSNQTASRTMRFQLRRERLVGGFRIASYSRKSRRSKRGVNFDVAYNLVRDYSWNWSSVDWTYNAVSSWRHGASFQMWIHSVLKLQAELTFGQFGSDIGGDTQMRIGLIYSRNSFY